MDNTVYIENKWSGIYISYAENMLRFGNIMKNKYSIILPMHSTLYRNAVNCRIYIFFFS